mgnify:CR=1 FL=1
MMYGICLFLWVPLIYTTKVMLSLVLHEQELLNKTETTLFTHFTNKSAIQLMFMECLLT